MPAAVVKGIIVSISIITALSIAVLENPQIQTWLEEQRRKIAEMLRSIGEELDPESRRVAEAFAFEGKTTDGIRREASGSQEAAAVATGRRLSASSSTIRRIPVKGPNDPDEAEERRRQGREYLARRNQQMYELQQKRQTAKVDRPATPPTPTSFDAMVDSEGKLKSPESLEKELPSPPTFEPVTKTAQDQMQQVERHLEQPLLANDSSPSGMSWFHMGSRLADPFSDEYAMDRSATPKPPVPPKVALEQEPTAVEHTPHDAPSILPTEAQKHQSREDREELSYEEQLAIALSLSEAENTANTATVRQRRHDDDQELHAAIAASLREMDGQQAAHAIAHAEPLTPQPVRQPTQRHILDMHDAPTISSPPTAQPESQADASWWRNLVKDSLSPPQGLRTLAQAHAERAPSETTDELYRVTPQLTRARLATLDAQQLSAPVDLMASQSLPQPAVDASFYSAPSTASPRPSSHTVDNEPSQLIDMNDMQQSSNHRPSLSRASTFDFRTDSESETFASLAGSMVPSQNTSHGVSDTEVVDVLDDSDVDMLSESGIMTPDSWTEVGSHDGEESEADPQEARRLQPSL
ncbi:hypothetical protein B0A50_02896 [Salinomyces thailandicus]|uniref:Uncharacterized protein n=1 Tax=Salinomyces thailandicus TaxID=706561 RepID=A0A4U0U5H7_9PEZI|nr:hypothetical protein B0A50_02896 [Salinomyces thailandica]